MAVLNFPISNDRVALEVAEAEFERMCATRRIDTDVADMSEDDAESFRSLRKRVLRAMQRGELVVSESGDPVYTPPGGKAITFYKPTGATFMAMDGKHDGPMARTVAAMHEMTRTARGEFAKLEGPDFQFCTALTTLFLAPR